MTEIARGELGAHAAEEVDDLRRLPAAFDLDLAELEDALPAVERLLIDDAAAFACVLRRDDRLGALAPRERSGPGFGVVPDGLHRRLLAGGDRRRLRGGLLRLGDGDEGD